MAAAATLTKTASVTLGSPRAPASKSDVLFEVLLVMTAATGDWIECGGSTPATQLVRQPIAAFITAQDSVGAAAIGHATGVYAELSGTKVVIKGGGTMTSAYFWVLIFGTA